jgi:hypothetical protein
MIATFSASSKLEGVFFLRIFPLWRLYTFGKVRFSSVESKIFLIKRKKIHLETTKLEQKEKPLLPMDDNDFRYKQKFLEKTLTTRNFFNLVEIP